MTRNCFSSRRIHRKGLEIFRKRQFVHRIFCSQFLCPLTPPPSQPAKWWISSWIPIKRTSTELRTLSQKCERTLQKLRTNRIMNKRALLKISWDISSQLPQKMLGPPAPVLRQWKNFVWCTAGVVEDFAWNLLWQFFLELEGRESAKNCQRHLHLQPHTGCWPTIHEQTHQSLYPLASDGALWTSSKRAGKNSGVFGTRGGAFYQGQKKVLRADFREGDEDSNFSVFRVQRFSEWPEPLHWIAFPVEILTKPLIHWIASTLFTEKPLFSLKSASSHPLPKNRLWGTPKNLRDKDFAELSDELSRAIWHETLVFFYWEVASNCSANSLVLCLRFCLLWDSFWFLIFVKQYRRFVRKAFSFWICRS